MRIITTVLMMSLSFPAFAEVFEGVKNVKEVPSGEPGVFKFEITEDDEGGGQAAVYTAPKLDELYERLQKEYAPLKSEVEAIYDSNGCDPDGTYKDKEMSDMFCGQLAGAHQANTVLWSYGRGGWASAGAMYKSFLAWTNAGSGSFTDVSIELTTLVSVEARELSDGPVVFEVTIDMSKFRRVLESQN